MPPCASSSMRSSVICVRTARARGRTRAPARWPSFASSAPRSTCISIFMSESSTAYSSLARTAGSWTRMTARRWGCGTTAAGSPWRPGCGIAANDRNASERLLRDCSRAPLAAVRLEELDFQRLTYHLPKPGGRTQRNPFTLGADRAHRRTRGLECTATAWPARSLPSLARCQWLWVPQPGHPVRAFATLRLG